MYRSMRTRVLYTCLTHGVQNSALRMRKPLARSGISVSRRLLKYAPSLLIKPLSSQCRAVAEYVERGFFLLSAFPTGPCFADPQYRL